MSGKFKLRIGDVVYHRSRDLGRGRVRYTYHEIALVDFEQAPAQRYLKNQLCKSPVTVIRLSSEHESKSGSTEK